jgi:hypothetical protein
MEATMAISIGEGAHPQCRDDAGFTLRPRQDAAQTKHQRLILLAAALAISAPAVVFSLMSSQSAVGVAQSEQAAMAHPKGLDLWSRIDDAPLVTFD